MPMSICADSHTASAAAMDEGLGSGLTSRSGSVRSGACCVARAFSSFVSRYMPTSAFFVESTSSSVSLRSRFAVLIVYLRSRTGVRLAESASALALAAARAATAVSAALASSSGTSAPTLSATEDACLYIFARRSRVLSASTSFSPRRRFAVLTLYLLSRGAGSPLLSGAAGGSDEGEGGGASL